MSTIYDVAKFAGVSKSTVSLVLNNSSLVKKDTADKVLAAIKALNYVPNNNAQALSSKKNYCIGIIIMADSAAPSSYDFDTHVGLCSYNITTGIMDALMDTTYGSLIERYCSVANPGELPYLIRNKRVDGALIIGSPFDSSMIEKIKAMKFPLCLVGVSSYANGVDSVRANPAEGVVMGLKYLVEKGHRKILFINSPTIYISSYVREKALYRAANEIGISINPEWVVNCSDNVGSSAYETMKKSWEEGARPDAILCANGHLALGAMRYLYEIGVRVPDDISVFGYEDSSMSGYSIPALTTINIHKEEMGRVAARCLLERIENPEKKACEIVIPADIVVRDSVIDRNV